ITFTSDELQAWGVHLDAFGLSDAALPLLAGAALLRPVDATMLADLAWAQLHAGRLDAAAATCHQLGVSAPGDPAVELLAAAVRFLDAPGTERFAALLGAVAAAPATVQVRRLLARAAA